MFLGVRASPTRQKLIPPQSGGILPFIGKAGYAFYHKSEKRDGHSQFADLWPLRANPTTQTRPSSSATFDKEGRGNEWEGKGKERWMDERYLPTYLPTYLAIH